MGSYYDLALEVDGVTEADSANIKKAAFPHWPKWEENFQAPSDGYSTQFKAWGEDKLSGHPADLAMEIACDIVKAVGRPLTIRIGYDYIEDRDYEWETFDADDPTWQQE